MAMGKVYFPKGAPWAEALVSELMMFPNGKNDDQVDVLSLIGRMLDAMLAGNKPKAEKKIPVTTMPTLKKLTDQMDRDNRNKRY